MTRFDLFSVIVMKYKEICIFEVSEDPNVSRHKYDSNYLIKFNCCYKQSLVHVSASASTF